MSPTSATISSAAVRGAWCRQHQRDQRLVDHDGVGLVDQGDVGVG
jgi:hypothetical protein